VPSQAGVGTVFKLSPAAGQKGWAEQVLHSFGGKGDGIGPYAGPIFDHAGNLFGTTYFSDSGVGSVYELSPPAAGKTAWSENLFTTSPVRRASYRLGGLVLGSGGNLFGTTETGLFAPYTHGTVFQLKP
jgi:outer membrane protein assembly factor BamB